MGSNQGLQGHTQNHGRLRVGGLDVADQRPRSNFEITKQLPNSRLVLAFTVFLHTCDDCVAKSHIRFFMKA
jgi:hypothetical protein